MSSCKYVQSWMSCNCPKAIVFSSKCMQACSFWSVPNSNTFVLRVRNNQILPWMKQYAANIVIMSATGIDLPCLIESKYRYVSNQIISCFCLALYHLGKELYFREINILSVSLLTPSASKPREE